MEVKNNPASRLHELLQTAVSQPKNQTTRQALAAVFGIEADDTRKLLRMLATLIDLAEETKHEISRLDDVNHDLLLRPFDTIDDLFVQVNLESGWGGIQQKIDETTLYGLEVAADKLGRVGGFTGIADETIAEIRQTIDQLHEQAIESDLPEQLQHLLLRNLAGLRYALDIYRIRGIDGIQEGVERAFGSIAFHHQQIEASPEEQKSLWKSFVGILRTLNEVVGSARNLQTIAPKIMEYLPELVK